MPKVMLVEDDNNLREIYEARLLAEGYEIVSAQDGEEALALAVKEKPDLIIADIMMPKISGFDMLDILRSTPETKDTKVIMMTALSQAEDKERAHKLGADRYLVKSQVTLEDVARVAHEVLENPEAAGPGATPSPSPSGMGDGGTTPQEPPSNPTTDSSAGDSTTPSTPSEPTTAPAGQSETARADTELAQDEAAIAVQLHQPAAAPESNQPIASEPASQASTPIPVASEPAPTPSMAEPPSASANPEPSTETSSNNEGVLAAALASVNSTPAPTADVTTPTSPTSDLVAKHSVAVASNSDTSDSSEEQPKTAVHTKTINPINDLSQQANNFQTLLAKEEAKEQSGQTTQAIEGHKATVADVSGEAEKPEDTPVTTIAPTQPPDPSSIAL